jgi:formylglycine-generating enzyme
MKHKQTILCIFSVLAVSASCSLLVAVASEISGVTNGSTFAPTVPNKTPPPTNALEGMVWISGGEFSMGCTLPSEGVCTMATMNAVNDAQPIHRVYVDGFWMNKTDVTNEEFAKFIEATGYVTIAELAPTKEQYPTAPPENLVAGSPVFTPPGSFLCTDQYCTRYMMGTRGKGDNDTGNNNVGFRCVVSTVNNLQVATGSRK